MILTARDQKLENILQKAKRIEDSVHPEPSQTTLAVLLLVQTLIVLFKEE